MALIKCKECGGQVGTDAEACPTCGTRSFRKSSAPMLLVGFIVAAVLVNYVSKEKEQTNDTRVGLAAPSGAATVTAEPDKVRESCSQIAKILGYDSDLTSAQKNDRWDSQLKGKHFEWRGQLLSVEKQADDGYEVVFVCLPPKSRAALLAVSYPVEMKTRVLKFKKGSVYSIAGVLRGYETPPDEISEQVSIRISAEAIVKPDADLRPIGNMASLPSAAVKKESSGLGGNWWIIKNGTSCFPAVGVVSPSSIVGQNPQCRDVTKKSDPGGVLFLDCRQSPLQTQFAFARSLELCRQMIQRAQTIEI